MGSMSGGPDGLSRAWGGGRGRKAAERPRPARVPSLYLLLGDLAHPDEVDGADGQQAGGADQDRQSHGNPPGWERGSGERRCTTVGQRSGSGRKAGESRAGGGGGLWREQKM